MSRGLYVHIPFCVRKCLYCDFYSVTNHQCAKEYVDAVLAEYNKYGGDFDTVFIGGGTPTSIGGELVRLCRALPKAGEFTVEANPGTVSPKLLCDLRSAGVNRLSLGVQSFNDGELKALGRIHTASQAEAAFRMARGAGFDNINLDLMLSTPGQSLESVRQSLDKIADLRPEHVSAYSLIVEEGTPFYDMDLNLPDEDEEREIYYATREFLDKIGIKQYEISNFALPGKECRHNLKYWSGEEYIGLGAAAASCLGSRRWRNEADLAAYISGGECREDVEVLDDDELLRERFWLGLRKTEGIEYGGEFADTVSSLIADGLLEMAGTRLRLTRRGIDLANVVFAEFV